jgi:hypothetical protein
MNGLDPRISLNRFNGAKRAIAERGITRGCHSAENVTVPECLHRVVAEGPAAQLVFLPIMVCQTRDRIAAQGSPGFCPGFLLTRQQLAIEIEQPLPFQERRC